VPLNNVDIEIVDSFMYVRSVLNTSSDKLMEIKRRIFVANGAYF
jgi:hypothetical protein